MRRHHTFAPDSRRHSYSPFGHHYFVSNAGGFLHHYGDPKVILRVLELTTNRKEGASSLIGASSLDKLTQISWEHSIFCYETAVREVSALSQSILHA